MAALVQSFPQQTSTITMLQTRPNSASGMLPSPPNQNQQFYNTGVNVHRNSYHGLNNGPSTSTYRGQTTGGFVSPYAFTSTPNAIASIRTQQPPHLRPESRTISAPAASTLQNPDASRSRYPANASISTISSSSSSDVSGGKTSMSRDGSGQLTPAPMLAPPTQTTVKSSPERYRRPGNRRGESTGSMPSTPSPVSTPTAKTFAPQHKPFSNGHSNGAFQTAVDDMYLVRQPSALDDAARNRRRSVHTVDLGHMQDLQDPSQMKALMMQGYPKINPPAGNLSAHQHPLRSSPVGQVRPTSPFERVASYEQQSATNNQPAATKATSVLLTNPAQAASPPVTAESNLKHDQPQLVDIPPRGSSDAAKRVNSASPLSRPMTMSSEPPATKDSFASTVSTAFQSPAKPTYAQAASGTRPESPAAKHLAAVNDKDAKKKSSRLRRAFSFGSAAELRKASIEPTSNANNASAADRARLRKERYQDEREAEQERIAQRQEAGGIGAGIYSGQGNFFSGSTDNLSISSTASSASIMLRKMGKGMKKSTRSLVGLFRPKSVIGVPAADGPFMEASHAQVSMVTVEAERERVNVNASPLDQAGGGTAFPQLERNSVDAASATLVDTEAEAASRASTSTGRRSIVGGEKERAELLATMKKGILKRAVTEPPTSSTQIRPVDTKMANFALPKIHTANDSPISSAPSTPNDEAQGHKRTGSVALNGDDYFMSALRFKGESRSLPGTPHGNSRRNATFSPRIQFHDTWPSGEYDRRGEIATCNRLTPMLAQQIKEELNTFKMEMEVHENSKIYTHFF